MKISTKVELGVVALADIALYSENGSTVSAAEVAQRQGISQKYLEQILVALRQGGFIRGQKGSHGGYTLSRPADKISFSDILNALDNNILADTYITDDASPADDIRSSVNDCVWNKLNCYLREFTACMTLSDFIVEYKSSQADGGDMYYI